MEVGVEMMSLPKLDYFEETELRLGLPGGGGKEKDLSKNMNANGKRGFEEAMDLKLKLSSKDTVMDPTEKMIIKNKELEEDVTCIDDSAKPPAKAQVVGWPPVRNFRKNLIEVQKMSSSAAEGDDGKGGGGAAAALVKVSMDGAPYLRKVDLNLYKSYQDLSDALANMFSSFTTGNYEGKGMIDFMKENKLMDLLNSSDYVPTYEDKDGDWMLVGDVPWKMFVESCKRLRIMKGTDAAGLAPRAMEKCKNRSSRGQDF